MTVFVAKSLKEQFPKFHEEFTGHLTARDIPCAELDTQNLWTRDWMPIKTADGTYTKFAYKSNEIILAEDYKNFPQLEVKDACWNWIKALYLNTLKSEIILDGGNVAQNEDCVLMTDIVFRHNSYSPGILSQALEKRFGKKIVFLPAEPGDELGHIDGIANFIDEKRVFINDYSVMNDRIYNVYQELITEILIDNGLEPVVLPYAYHKCPQLSEEEFYAKYPFADDQNPGVGYYINYLVLPGVIFIPAFGFDDDMKVEVMIKEYYPNHDVIPLDCFDLAMLGGLIHCVTWED